MIRFNSSLASPNLADCERPAFSWEQSLPKDTYVHFKIRRTFLIAAIVSLLIHALLFFAFHLRIEQAPIAAVEAPLTIQLAAAENSAAANAVNKAPETAVQAQGKPEAKQKPLRQPRAVPRPSIVSAKPKQTPVVNVVNNKSELSVPLAKALPTTPSEPVSQMAAPTDMMSFVNAARARREAAESAAAGENAEAMLGARKPSDDEKRSAIIQRNLNPGTNGIFQIIRINPRDATFSFRGWTTSMSNSRLETIQVEVSNGDDIHHAIIRKMIELIRRHYKGDFTWESQRLGRDVRLSARLDDNTGLEDFMMKEFF